MRIKELDFDIVPDQAVLIFIGRRKSGKTTNIIDTFYKKRYAFKMGLVFCGSKATIKDYKKHFPHSFIFYGYHSDVLGAIINKQELDVEKGIAKPIFILVDDCMWAKKSILGDPNIRRVFMNGRHSLIFFVLSMQYCMDLHPSLRQQIDFTFLSREKNPQNRERLYKNYNVCFKSYQEFESCMQSCTMNHETLVLNNGNSESDKIEDNVNWWRSKHVSIEKGGRRFRVNPNGTWWQFHHERFNPEYYNTNNTTNSTTPKNMGNGMIVTKVKTTKFKRKRKDTRKRTPAMPSTQTKLAADWMQKQRHQNIGDRRSSFSSSSVKYIDENVKYC